MKIKLITIGLLICLFQTNLVAQKVYRLSLNEAVLFGLENSTQLENSKLDKLIAEQQIKKAKASILPTANISGQFSDNFSLPQQILPGEVFGQPGTSIPVTFGVRYGVTATAQVNQVLYNQKAFTAIQSANQFKALSRINELSSKEELIYNLVSSYLQVQVAEQQLSLVKANLSNLDKLYEISKVQFENAMIKENDMKQIAVNRTNTWAALKEVEYNIVQLKNMLKLYMNLDISSEIILTDDLESQDDTLQLNHSLQIESNFKYQLIKQQIDLNETEKKSVMADYFPTLSAFVNYGYQGQTNEFQFSGVDYNDFYSGTWGLNLQIPIFNGFQKRRNYQINKLEGMKLQNDKTRLEQSISMQYSNAKKRLELSGTQVESQEENMKLANEVLETTLFSYKEGVSSLTELLEAEKNLTAAQSSYISNLLQVQIAKLEYLKSSGQLAELVKTELN